MNDQIEKQAIEEMAKYCPCYFGEKCCIDGELPEKCDMLCQFGTYAEILYNAGYRKQSENVIELPCKVGTTVYKIEPLWFGVWGDDEHECRKCEHFYEGGMGDHPDCSLGKNCCYEVCEEVASARRLVGYITPSEFTEKIEWGKTVFLTKKEAEEALAKMKGGGMDETE